MSSGRGPKTAEGEIEGRCPEANYLNDSADKGLSVDMSGKDNLDDIPSSWFLSFVFFKKFFAVLFLLNSCVK